MSATKYFYRLTLYWYGQLVEHQPLSVCVCVSADISPYCSAHGEWLIMKLCMHVGYHDANNVSNVGGDPVTHFFYKKNVKKCLRCFTGTAHHIAVARPLVLRLLLRDHAQAAGVWKTDAVNLYLIGHTSLSTALVCKKKSIVNQVWGRHRLLYSLLGITRKNTPTTTTSNG